jgi:hypothetical protein
MMACSWIPTIKITHTEREKERERMRSERRGEERGREERHSLGFSQAPWVDIQTVHEVLHCHCYWQFSQQEETRSASELDFVMEGSHLPREDRICSYLNNRAGVTDEAPGFISPTGTFIANQSINTYCVSVKKKM